jgi:hypothetical protein
LFTTDVFPDLRGREFHITGESYAVSLNLTFKTPPIT